MGGEEYKVDLKRFIGLVSPSYSEVHMHPDGRWHLSHAASKIDDCLYEARGEAITRTGSAAEDGAVAMMSLCGGLSTLNAVVVVGGEVVELHYVAVLDKHVAFKHTDYPHAKEGQCGVRDTHDSHDHHHDHDHHHYHHDQHQNHHDDDKEIVAGKAMRTATRRLLAGEECTSRPQKVVEMVVVNDAAQYNAKGWIGLGCNTRRTLERLMTRTAHAGMDMEAFAAQVVAQASLLLAKLTVRHSQNSITQLQKS
jgi:hypothetical protein